MNRHSDSPEPFTIAAPEPRRPSGRAILLAGVAGACVLGVGMGLWARPGMHERQSANVALTKATTQAPATARRLEIVVDDHPRATGAPIEVLRPGVTAAAPAPVAQPVRPPEGLMRTRDDGPAAPRAAEASPLKTMRPVIAAAFSGARLVLARLEHPAPPPADINPPSKTETAEAKDERRADLAKAQARELAIARADAARAEAHRAELAKAEFEQSQTAKAEQEAQLAEAAAAKAEAAKAAAAKAEARKVQLAKAEAAKAAAAKAAAARAEAEKVELAKAAAAKAEAHRVELAKAEAAKAAKATAAKAAKAEAHRIELAKADAAKADAHRQALARAEAAKAHKLELAREAQAEKAEQIKLAKAEARAKAAQREEARLEALADAAEAKKHAQLARLAHALAHAVMGRDRPAPVAEAKLDRKRAHAQHDLKVQQVSAHKRHGPPSRTPVVVHPSRAHPEVVPPPTTASGLMRVSTSPRCASRDPGEALVCADPSLTAADRQLVRAYQGARNAGVPEAQLQASQQRWLAARAAAAREAPWAVRDVYMARIAELNGQAKEAQGGY